MKFGTLDYKNTTAFLNFYYRNYDLIPFDLHISHGEYLAGDIGSTIELSRKYLNGMELGVFASFTDVTSEQFGEVLLIRVYFLIFQYMVILLIILGGH